MACSCPFCADRKKVEDEFTAYGMSLMNPPSSGDELFRVLQKVESLLKMVGQDPCDSTTNALQFVTKALGRNELLRHSNEDVKISVVSCITEISRIFAPKYPYDDHKQVEEILQQTVMALRKLSDVSSRSYRKVVRVLEILAKVRACAVLLDIENETLIIEIFKLFLEVIRPYHPRNIFTWMKEIMTRIIEGSGELSVELLRPLLDSLQIDNQVASPVAAKLGEEVLKDCAATVKPHLAEALMSMRLDPDDNAEIVALLCIEMPEGEEMMGNANAPVPEAKCCEPALQDDTQREKLKDSCTTNIMKPDIPEAVQPSANENQEGDGSRKLAGSSGHHYLVSESHTNSTGTHAHWFQPKKNEILINEDTELVVLLPIDDVPQSQVQKEDTLHLGLTLGQRTERTLCAKRKRGRDSRKNESASDCDAERKSESSIKNEGNLKEHKEPSLQQIYGMKQKKKKKKKTEESGDKDSKRACTSKDHGAELIGAKIKIWWPLDQAFYEGVISSFDSETNKHKVIYDDGEVEKLILHKERWEMLEDNSSQKDSKRPCTIKDYGKELVGARIKVWWPLDEKFYEGVVSSFDPVKRKYKVVYDDGEVEKLRLHKERWEMLEDNSSQKDHGLDFQGHAVSSAMSSKRKAKRNSSTGPNISSSKRS